MNQVEEGFQTAHGYNRLIQTTCCVQTRWIGQGYRNRDFSVAASFSLIDADET